MDGFARYYVVVAVCSFAVALVAGAALRTVGFVGSLLLGL